MDCKARADLVPDIQMETNSRLKAERRSRKEPALIRTTENRPGAGIRSNHSRHCVMAADSTVISTALRGCWRCDCGGRDNFLDFVKEKFDDHSELRQRFESVMEAVDQMRSDRVFEKGPIADLMAHPPGGFIPGGLHQAASARPLSEPRSAPNRNGIQGASVPEPGMGQILTSATAGSSELEPCIRNGPCQIIQHRNADG